MTPMMRFIIVCLVAGLTANRVAADAGRHPRTPTFAFTHVRVIDGTGAPAKDDQTVLIENRRIQAVGPSASVHLPPNTETIDLPGRTVVPGLVGMHEHLFYQLEPPGSEEWAIRAGSTFAKLYLAAGLTTIRTAGTIDFNADKWTKRWIDEGKEPGPKIHLTSHYLEAIGERPDADAMARLVEQFADAGATSFKAYTSLRSAELKAVIAVAHRRGLQVTGHLCAVGFREAAALGIDNVEHGLPFDTDLYSGKRPDECPNQNDVFAEVARLDMSEAQIVQAIAALIRHGVAVTSTLAVLESFTGSDAAFDPRVRPLLTSRLVDAYDAAAAVRKDPNTRSSRLFAGALRKEMLFERAFVASGGKLMAGADPTGWGGVVAGFGDQRELELLVEAGFAPEKAIQIATSNGANFLREGDVGTIAPGFQADLVVVHGNPARRMADMRDVEMVIKDGVAYDPTALIAEAQGRLGAFEMSQLMTWPVFAIACLIPAYAVLRLRKRRRS